MWHVKRTIENADTWRWTLHGDDRDTLTFQAVCEAWRSNPSFRDLWIANLRTVPFDAYAWECPPVTADSAGRTFECVFVASPMLARMPPDPRAFAEHFRPDTQVVAFENLGGDAVLVAPCPSAARSNYSHLASFNKTAPAGQQDALWQSVGQAMERRIGTRPVWLSTAGLGVAWLHVRLDDFPKYYRHVPYASDHG